MFGPPASPTKPGLRALAHRQVGRCDFCLRHFKGCDVSNPGVFLLRRDHSNHCLYCNSPRRSTHFRDDSVSEIQRHIHQDADYRANWFLRSFFAAVMWEKKKQVIDIVAMRKLPWISAEEWPVPAPTAQDLVEYRLVPLQSAAFLPRGGAFADVCVSGYHGKAVPSSLLGANAKDYVVVPESQRVIIEGPPPFWALFFEKDLKSHPINRLAEVLGNKTSPCLGGQKQRLSGQVGLPMKLDKCRRMTANQALKGTSRQDIVKALSLKKFKNIANNMENGVLALSDKTIPDDMSKTVASLKTCHENCQKFLAAVAEYKDDRKLGNKSFFLSRRSTLLGLKAGTESGVAELADCIVEDFAKERALADIAEGDYHEFCAIVSAWNRTNFLENLSEAMCVVLRGLGEVKPKFQNFMAAAGLPNDQAELIWIVR